MALQRQIPTPEPMNLKGNLSDNWKYFKESWEHYLKASKLDKEEDKECVASTLLSIVGKETYRIYQNLPMTEAERKDEKMITKHLGDYFEPQKNVIFETYVFNTANQEPDEGIELYVNRLRKLAATCDFDTLTDRMIRDRLVLGIRDNSVRKRLLREKDLTLEKAVEMIRAAERAAEQTKKIDGEVETVNAVAKSSYHAKSSGARPPKFGTCKFCGDKHEFIKEKCPAYGKRCRKCHGRNHIDKVCKKGGARPHKQKKRSKPKVHQLDKDEESDTDSDYSDGSVFTVTSTRSKYMVEPLVKANLKKAKWMAQKFQLDSGASVNCMKYSDCCKILNSDKPQLKHSNIKLTAYSGQKMIPVGQVTLKMKINGVCDDVLFQVIDEAPGSLLSGETCVKFGLVSVNQEVLVNTLQMTSELSKEDILNEFADVFTGLGDIGEYHIELKEGAKPKQDMPRGVPVAFKPELKPKLDSMEKQGQIIRETEPTDWISSAVYVKTPNKLRVCLDPQELNKHVLIPKYHLPTIDDVTTKMSKVKIFSVCDAKDGFLQVRLDEESSKLTTFHTPHGRYRWLRLPFGLCSAPEEFQRRVMDVIDGLEGVDAIADDILITGVGDTLEEAIKDHDKNMISFLERCRERNFKLKKEKLRFKEPSVVYHGHVFSAEGLKADPRKVEAIREMPRPRDKTEVKRLLGMVNYLHKFCPQLSDVSSPLRELTREGAEFVWSQTQEDAFQRLKRMISEAPTLRFYDVNEEVTVEADASDYALGCVLLQKSQPVAFASRTLTPTERNYSQMEKECLALTFACVRFNDYIQGRENVTVYTDHKSLETIFKKPILAAPKRLQRMRLRLQKYHLNVIYKPGKEMIISDHLSRSAIQRKSNKEEMHNYEIFQLDEELRLEQEIENIDYTLYHNVSDITMTKVQKETEVDETLQELMTICHTGWPEDKMEVPENLREYWPFRDEISCQSGVLYRGTRVIIPTSMRKSILEKAHKNHAGYEATLNKCRDTVYWKTINNDVKDTVERCSKCQEEKPSQPKQPMKSQPIPKRRWQIASSDLFTVNGKDYVIVVDHLTKFWEIEMLTETTSEETIDKIKSVFARHGIPLLAPCR